MEIEKTSKPYLIATLLNAVITKEIVLIKYHGGSQPGTVREIVPLEVRGRHVCAVCVATDHAKLYLLDKMDLVDGAEKISYDPKKIVPDKAANLRTAITPFLSKIQAMGLHFELSEFSASLHGFFKNGKIRKTPIAGILYDETRSPPWWVYSPDSACNRTYGSPEKAVAYFLVLIKIDERSNIAA